MKILVFIHKQKSFKYTSLGNDLLPVFALE